MTAIRAAFALTVVGVALAACGDAPPTPAPTASPTTAPINARESVEQACEALTTSDYDIVYTNVDTRHEGALTIETQVSGDDMRQVLRNSTPIKETVTEIIHKDGVTYSRENLNADPNSFSDWRIIGQNMPTSEFTLCLDPEIFIDSVAQESSSSERRYSFNHTSEDGSIASEVWVDSSGRPSRLRTTTTFPIEGVMGGATGAGDDAAPGQITITEVYSGFDEPNIITAPIPPVAPTPAPAPTPTINPDAVSSPGGVIDSNGAMRVASLILYRAMGFDASETMVMESIVRDFAARHGSAIGETQGPDRPIWTIIARGDGVDQHGDAYNTLEAAIDKATGEPVMVVTYFGEPDLAVPVLTPTPTVTPQPRFAAQGES